MDTYEVTVEFAIEVDANCREEAMELEEEMVPMNTLDQEAKCARMIN